MDPGAIPPPPAFIYEGSAVLCQDQRMLNNHSPIFPLVTSTLSTSAHGGDVSCSFESSRWDRDHCNWEYAFEAENLFMREFEPASDPMPSRKAWAHGNHYLKEEGPAYIRLQTKGDFLCSSISGEAPFGFDYKLTSGKVICAVTTAQMPKLLLKSQPYIRFKNTANKYLVSAFLRHRSLLCRKNGANFLPNA